MSRRLWQPSLSISYDQYFSCLPRLLRGRLVGSGKVLSPPRFDSVEPVHPWYKGISTHNHCPCDTSDVMLAACYQCLPSWFKPHCLAGSLFACWLVWGLAWGGDLSEPGAHYGCLTAAGLQRGCHPLKRVIVCVKSNSSFFFLTDYRLQCINVKNQADITLNKLLYTACYFWPNLLVMVLLSFSVSAEEHWVTIYLIVMSYV